MTEEEKAAAEAAAKAEAEAAAAKEAEQKEKEAEAAKAAGTTTDDAPKDDPAAAALAAKDAEIARLQQIADKFAGIDPEKAKADAAAVAAAEAAKVQAEKDKAQAEGNFEKLREIQNAESAAAIAAAKAEAEAAQKERDEARAQLNNTKIEAAFANSKFLQDETILTGPKAQRLYADHVEVEDGKVVVYDKPKGEAKRARVMDGKGNALSFNDAIAKIVNADPDKDTLLKTKTKPGAASGTTEGKSKAPEQSRHARLAAGLKALREK